MESRVEIGSLAAFIKYIDDNIPAVQEGNIKFYDQGTLPEEAQSLLVYITNHLIREDWDLEKLKPILNDKNLQDVVKSDIEKGFKYYIDKFTKPDPKLLKIFLEKGANPNIKTDGTPIILLFITLLAEPNTSKLANECLKVLLKDKRTDINIITNKLSTGHDEFMLLTPLNWLAKLTLQQSDNEIITSAKKLIKKFLNKGADANYTTRHINNLGQSENFTFEELNKQLKISWKEKTPQETPNIAGITDTEKTSKLKSILLPMCGITGIAVTVSIVSMTALDLVQKITELTGSSIAGIIVKSIGIFGVGSAIAATLNFIPCALTHSKRTKEKFIDIGLIFITNSIFSALPEIAVNYIPAVEEYKISLTIGAYVLMLIVDAVLLMFVSNAIENATHKG